MDSLLPHLPEYPDGIGNAGFQRVVGIYQQSTGIRIQFCVFLECRVFILEAHDPAMGVCPHDRHVEHLPGQHVGCAHAAADDSRPCAVQSGIRPLGPAQPEFHDAVPLRRVNDPGSLGGDQALVVDDIEDRRLHKLGLHDRRDDLEQRFLRENDRTLGDGIDAPAEMKAA